MTNNRATRRQSRAFDFSRLLLIIACYLLAFGSFEQFHGIGSQDRAVPENLHFDAIAAYKAVTRVLAFAMVALGLLALRQIREFPRIFRSLLPWVGFSLWAVLTAAWSPMPAYSFGHAMEFLMLVLIALLAGVAAVQPGGARTVLAHACLIQFVYLGVLLALWLIDPARASILRPTLETESPLLAASPEATFVKNPAEIACVASLAVVLLLAFKLMRNAERRTRNESIAGSGMRIADLPWLRAGFWPLLLFGWAMLFITQTRSLVATAVLLSIVALVLLTRARWMAAAIAAGCFAFFIYLFADPYLDRVAAAADRAGAYLQRGQSTLELRGLGGRLENWSGVVDGLNRHPEALFVGFGYSMATPTGKMWHEDAYRRYTGHNIMLDVLAGTGLIGLIPFLLGFGWLFVRSGLGALRPGGGLDALAVLALLFALLSGIFGDSIVGPLDPSSVAVFAVIGCSLSRLSGGSNEPRVRREGSGQTEEGRQNGSAVTWQN